MRLFTLLTYFTLGSFLLHGQVDRLIRKGDKELEDYKYNSALLNYMLAYEDTMAYDLAGKIADAYFYLQSFEKAEEWYFRRLGYLDQSQEDYMNYIKCLLANLKYRRAEEATVLMEEYFPESEKVKMFSHWVETRIYDPCMADYAKDDKISFCIELNAGPSRDPGNPDMEFLWQLENGQTYRGDKMKHCFRSPGNHRIMLMAVDSSLNVRRTSDTTLVVSFLSEADFVIAGSRQKNEEVKFYAYNLMDHPQYYGMAWEFGDGDVKFGEGVNHQFRKRGSYYIHLLVFGQQENGDIYTIGCLSKIWNVVDD